MHFWDSFKNNYAKPMCSGEMKTRWCVFQSKYKLNQPFTIIGLSNISYVLFSCSDLCYSLGLLCSWHPGKCPCWPHIQGLSALLVKLALSWVGPGSRLALRQNRQLMLLVSTPAAGAAGEGFVNESSILRGFWLLLGFISGAKKMWVLILGKESQTHPDSPACSLGEMERQLPGSSFLRLRG